MSAFPTFQLLIPIAVLVFAAYHAYTRMAASDQREDAFKVWATMHGYAADLPPEFASTPTLKLRDGQAHGCCEVTLGDSHGAMYRWTWTISDNRSMTERELNLDVERKTGEAMVVQGLLAAGFPHFRVVPRHGHDLPPGLGDERDLELESVEFQRDHRLLVGCEGDQDALVRLFDPETIVWWINQGSLAPIVEYQMGTLVVRSTLPLSEAGEYDMLLGQAQEIAGRVLAEGLLHQAS
jgi:hypothetical protein